MVDMVKRTVLVSAVVSFSIVAFIFLALVIIASKDSPTSDSNNEPKTDLDLIPGEPEIIPDLPPKKICLTPGCITTAASFLENMNKSINPCEDFYTFACGNFEKKTMIPYNHVLTQRPEEVSEHLDQVTRQLLETPKDANEKPIFQIVKDFYAGCMDTDRIEKLKSQPMLNLLDRLDGWPALQGNKSDETKYNWMKSVVDLGNHGLLSDQIISVTVDVNHFGTSPGHSIQIKKPSFAVPNTNYLKTKLEDSDVLRYYKMMSAVSVIIGETTEEVDEYELDASILQILKFESQLLELVIKSEHGNEMPQSYRMSLKDLTEKVHEIEWTKFIGEMTSQNLEKTEMVTLHMEPQTVKDLILFVNGESKRTVVNYILWRAIHSTYHLLHKELQDIWRTYNLKMPGIVANTIPRWRYCVEQTRSSFGIVVGHMYVKNFRDEESYTQTRTMVKDLREEFNRILEEAEWMDVLTRQRALKKANSMEVVVAYPPEILNDTKLDNYYRRQLSIAKEDYFGSVLEINRFQASKILNKLRKPRNRTSWDETGAVAVMNAFYNLESNVILIPAGIIQGLYWSADRPNYVNYAIIGFIIGHEITHAFDNSGKMFDENGQANDWWEQITNKRFTQKSKCFVNQYGNVYIPGTDIRVNGVLTLGENIADNGGVKNAYRAYAKWVENNGPEVPLPGFEYDVNQLFWISYANNWCNKLEVKETGFHSPYKYRTNILLSNFPEFAKDFNCPNGSPMNPFNKCKVW